MKLPLNSLSNTPVGLLDVVTCLTVTLFPTFKPWDLSDLTVAILVLLSYDIVVMNLGFFWNS